MTVLAAVLRYLAIVAVLNLWRGDLPDVLIAGLLALLAGRVGAAIIGSARP